MIERRTLTVPEVAQMLGISRGAAYKAARSGELPAVRIGDRFVIPRSALEKLLGEKLGVGSRGAA